MSWNPCTRYKEQHILVLYHSRSYLKESHLSICFFFTENVEDVLSHSLKFWFVYNYTYKNNLSSGSLFKFSTTTENKNLSSWRRANFKLFEWHQKFFSISWGIISRIKHRFCLPCRLLPKCIQECVRVEQLRQVEGIWEEVVPLSLLHPPLYGHGTAHYGLEV